MPLMPFQMEVKISFTPVQTISQSPVKIPAKTSNKPVSTPSTVSSTFSMISNTAIKTGASRLQKPSHILPMAAVMSSKLMPRFARRSLIPSTNPENTDLIFSQIAITFSRNSSFVFHRCTKAATSTATAAMTRPMGEVRKPMAFPSTPLIPPSPCIFVPRVMMPFPRLAKPDIAEPTVDMTFPSINSSGPIAATSASTLMMVSRWASLIPLSLSTKACTAATTFRMIGMSRSPKEIASSSSCDFNIVSCPDRLSCMISAMDSAEPSQLSMAPVSLSKSSSERRQPLPVLIRIGRPSSPGEKSWSRAD